MVEYFIEEKDLRINYYITQESDDLKEINKMDMNTPERKGIKSFECYKLYDDEELSRIDILKQFKIDFNNWSEEIRNIYDMNDYNYFDPQKYYTNKVMVIGFFKKYSYKILKKLNIKAVENDEAYIQTQPQGGGLCYLGEKGGQECYGYDYSGFYPNILGNELLNFEMPIKKGKYQHYNSVDDLQKLHRKKKLQYGYYYIKISSVHKDMKKVFSFSVNNCYTHTCLKFCFQYWNLYKITFEMIKIENNCYLYDEKDIIKSHIVFGDWFKQIKIFKDKLPKNRTIKHLSKSLWGHLTQYNRLYITNDEFISRDDIGYTIDEGKEYYLKAHHNENSLEIIKSNDAFKSNLSRIKSFLPAFARDLTARTIIKNKIHENIVRVQTDGIVLNKPFTFQGDYIPIPEDKTTGKIFWVSSMEYYHKCNNVNCENYFKFSKSKFCDECLSKSF